MKYSPTTFGFYDPEMNVDIPSDAIDITDSEYLTLKQGQQERKKIIMDSSGRPTLVDLPEWVQTVFSSRDYLKRFTMAEYSAARTGPMTVQYALDNLIGAQFIDLADPDVAAGLDAMVAAGIISASRKTELLQPQPA